MNIALFEPDIPQNTGTILRLGACLGIKIHIIGPCGFVFSPKNLRRYALDYLEHTDYMYHDDWASFYQFTKENNSRLILWTTKTDKPYWDVPPLKNDIFLFGNESSGVPEKIHNLVDESITIPMQKEMRSLNLATSVSFCASEILKTRNTHGS